MEILATMLRSLDFILDNGESLNSFNEESGMIRFNHSEKTGNNLRVP